MPIAPIEPQSDNILKIKTETLLAELGRVAERKSRLHKWWRTPFWICWCYEVGYGLLVKLLHLPVPTTYATVLEQLLNISIGIVFCTMMPEFLFFKSIAKSRRRIAMLLSELGKDSRAVGSLAQLCHATMVLSVSDIALEPLLKMLPTVKASDARYISDSQMEALLALLVVRRQDRRNERCKALPFAVLTALEQVGDSRAIEPVRRLTTGKRNRLYHQAAQECLAVLEQHGEERDYSRSLLLPASNEVSQEMLLRATTLPAETPPELLLRAATEEPR